MDDDADKVWRITNIIDDVEGCNYLQTVVSRVAKESRINVRRCKNCDHYHTLLYT